MLNLVDSDMRLQVHATTGPSASSGDSSEVNRSQTKLGFSSLSKNPTGVMAMVAAPGIEWAQVESLLVENPRV